MNKQNKIIVGVIALILALTIGYAVFTQSLNISGTATAKAEFSLIFESSSNEPTCGGFSGECTSEKLYSISQDGKTLTVTVDKLNYPTAYVKIPVIVKNKGTVDALLEKVNVDETTDNDDIDVTYTGVTENEVIKAEEQKDVIVKVEWNKDSTNSIVTPLSVTFKMSLSYAQKASIVDSGNTGGETEDTSWTYRVKKLNNDGGLITAYNYAQGTNIKIPAEVDGIPVTTIDANSFLQPGNVTVYQTEENKMYIVIAETGDNYTVVKNKLITMLTGECGEDKECANGMKSMVYFCSSNDSCYNLLEEENGTATVTQVPEGIDSMPMIISPDPDVSLEESVMEPGRNVSTLDLSKASNLTSIEEYSFDSSGLTSVNFGENSKLETIGINAFSGNQISSLTIPNSVTTIGNSAFSYSQINSLAFEENSKLETIENDAFSSNQISNLTIPDSVTSIGQSAFYGNQISSLTIPNSVTTIGYGAFSGNQISGELVIPNSVTTIGNQAFYNNQISNLTIPKTVTTFDASSFGNNPITTLSIGKCSTDICKYNSFGYSIKDLTIESGEIGYEAFGKYNDDYAKIENLTLGDGITSIGERAFHYNNISSLILPDSLVSIGENAFSSNQIDGLILPNSLTTIGNSAFYSNQISSLTFAENSSLTTIGNSAFSSNQISSLTIPNSVTTIGDVAFASNMISNNLLIPNSVITIGSYAFDSNQISSLTFAENSKLTIIGSSAFWKNQISSELVIPNSVTTIGTFAFYSNQISSLTFAENSKLTIIGSSAFWNNQISSELVIPNSVTTIGSQAFYGNKISGELVIPNSVTTIGNSAFESNQISSLTIPDSVTTIENGTFNANQISKLNLPVGLTSIGDWAFAQNQINSLTLPKTVATIGNDAFYINQISSLTIPNSVTTIGNDAFYSNPLVSILIKRTQEDFTANVTVGTRWYDTSNNPTITYEP